MKRISFFFLLVLLASYSCTPLAGQQLTPTIESDLIQTYNSFPTKTAQIACDFVPLASQTPTITPIAISGVIPLPSSTPTSTIIRCSNQAEFVRHLSMSDNTHLLPGTVFAKAWRILNTGTCIWTANYQFVYENGDCFHSPSEINLAREVKPGEVVDIQVTLRTPSEPGICSGHWMLRDPSGEVFGTGENGRMPFSILVVVEPLKLNERKEPDSCG